MTRVCAVTGKRPLSGNARSALIFAHNHPSGDLRPSKADLALTDRLRKALVLVDIELLDHLIVGKYGVVSIGGQI